MYHERMEYIEFKTASDAASLKGVKLIAYTGLIRKLILVSNMNNEVFNDKGFWVLSSDNFKEKGFIQKYTSTSETVLLLSGEEEPIVVTLL